MAWARCRNISISSSSTEKSFNIEESDVETSESEDEIIPHKNGHRRLVFDDSDAEEKEIERRALSPYTRRSNGYFYINSMNSSMKKQSKYNTENYADSNDYEVGTFGHKDIDSEVISLRYDNEKNLDNTPTNFQSFRKKLNQSEQLDNDFNLSSKKTHSSTMYENEILATFPVEKFEKDNISFRTSTHELPVSVNNVIEIIDSPQNLVTNKNKVIQPKITNFCHHGEKTTAKGKLPILNQGANVVSRKYYNKELKKLDDLKNNLVVCKNLISSVGSNLPDKGQRMLDTIAKLTQEIKQQDNYVSTLTIENQKQGKNSDLKVSPIVFKVPTLEQLSNEVATVKMKYTGSQSLATFNVQKALTVDCLKDIHGSLETCPNENVLADPPSGLKISLMKHQRHALAWMKWRENQKPRGGILADDMGLGKTLSMISLILASKEHQIEENEEESDSEEENKQWHRNGHKNHYKGGTIVICPASLIRQWENEINNHTRKHILNICVHHGNHREEKSRRLANYDVVITTYNIITREASNILGDITWERIILDEAHIIRNHKTLTSVAVCELSAKSRWALTGTPIQNRENDLYAIIKFLRCKPFDNLGHWKQWIDNKSAGGQQRLNTLVNSLMLRRTKTQLKKCGMLKDLPTKEVELIEVTLDKDEMNVYQKILIYSQSLFAQFLVQKQDKCTGEPLTATKKLSKLENEYYLKMYKKLSPFLHGHNNTEIKSYEILVLLLRLRQICCHPGLIDSMLDEENINSICSSSNENVCPEIDLFKQLEKLKICDSTEKDQLFSKAIPNILSKSNPVFNFDRPSSKFKRVLQLVREKLTDNNHKAIMVSQWTSVLNLIKKHLQKENIEIVSLDGSVPVLKRNEIVNDFNDPNNNKRIMLLSLTAGGVGLNLVGANHLFLMDLHWNPQLEAQASDRIYRVGQTKPVYIYKFYCKDTVEERIKSLQDYKLNVANDVLTGAKSNISSKLSMDDLKNLFGL